MDSLIIKNLIYATLIAFLLSLVLGPILIPFLRRLKLGQTQREDGPQSHLQKQGTPLMGGLIILSSMIITSMFFINGNDKAISVLLVTIAFGFIGFLDDFIKVILKRSKGLNARQKIMLQLIAAIGFGYYFMYYTSIGTKVIMPFANGMEWDLGIWFYPFLVFIVVGAVNAVNLTDGLDGLASGVTALVATFFAVISLGMLTELSPIICASIGSLLGFLLYNSHPARVFMGDTGSLALGGFVASIALLLKMPLFLAIVGIIYVVEALSVIIQVGVYKLTKKRVFKMAPIHHHFELMGWKETKVVAVFFIVTAIACLIGFLAL
ncbi:MAG TPA: phospho-N-acetylmuramoyl-pentapeptide-transferase [Clostridiales bacterium]|nr:MAG: phospho-N-acetylmuramoyl-pentapeptide-transferase [Clostridiales bacterium GWD2_32_19]HCC07986.1 phospho-N-acetylmuramoyl-pentapeptide-transferase [Clostridiales bacterium]